MELRVVDIKLSELSTAMRSMNFRAEFIPVVSGLLIQENMFVDFSLDDQLEFGLVVQIFQKARVGRST